MNPYTTVNPSALRSHTSRPYTYIPTKLYRV